MKHTRRVCAWKYCWMPRLVTHAHDHVQFIRHWFAKSDLYSYLKILFGPWCQVIVYLHFITRPCVKSTLFIRMLVLIGPQTSCTLGCVRLTLILTLTHMIASVTTSGIRTQSWTAFVSAFSCLPTTFEKLVQGRHVYWHKRKQRLHVIEICVKDVSFGKRSRP